MTMDQTTVTPEVPQTPQPTPPPTIPPEQPGVAPEPVTLPPNQPAPGQPGELPRMQAAQSFIKDN